MADIHDLPDETLRNGVDGIVFLVDMFFRDSTIRWWGGWGSLTTLTGVTYQGAGDAVQIAELEQSYGASAGYARFVFPNASPEMVRISRDQEEQAAGRRCTISYQMFSNAPGGHGGRLIGNPVSDFVGVMKDVTSFTSAEENTVELEAYGRLSRQGKPPFGIFNSTDQKRRHPGDRGFDLLPSLKDRSVQWSS